MARCSLIESIMSTTVIESAVGSRDRMEASSWFIETQLYPNAKTVQACSNLSWSNRLLVMSPYIYWWLQARTWVPDSRSKTKVMVSSLAGPIVFVEGMEGQTVVITLCGHQEKSNLIDTPLNVLKTT
jgi:hypothetical protein